MTISERNIGMRGVYTGPNTRLRGKECRIVRITSPLMAEVSFRLFDGNEPVTEKFFVRRANVVLFNPA